MPFDNPPPLPDLAADQPAGENLEFDPAFSELERLAQGKPEQQFGDTPIPAEEPEWKEVIAAGEALLERTYDLRVLALLAVARLHLRGVPGFAATAATIRELLETRWEPVHPQLDPEDDNDPTLRANALLTLADPVRVLRFLRLMPLARSPRTGTVCWRDVMLATGQLEIEGEVERMAESVIGGTFRDTDAAALAVLLEAVRAASGHVAAIPAAFNDRAGFGTGPDLDDLAKLLRDIVRIIETYGVPAEDAADAEAEAGAEPAEGEPAAAPSRARAAISIATLAPPDNRQDAARLLGLVIHYYERHEPSSPLPFILNRALRMVDMNFFDILRDMAPDGMSQAETVTGRTDG